MEDGKKKSKDSPYRGQTLTQGVSDFRIGTFTTRHPSLSKTTKKLEEGGMRREEGDHLPERNDAEKAHHTRYTRSLGEPGGGAPPGGDLTLHEKRGNQDLRKADQERGPKKKPSPLKMKGRERTTKKFKRQVRWVVALPKDSTTVEKPSNR